MVKENICYLLNNFLKCSAYENIIFCWVMHEQSVIDAILQNLDIKKCTVKVDTNGKTVEMIVKELKKI